MVIEAERSSLHDLCECECEYEYECGYGVSVSVSVIKSYRFID